MARNQSESLASLDNSSISSIAEKLQDSVKFLLSLSKEDEALKSRYIQEFASTNPSLLTAIHCLVTAESAPGTSKANVPLENPFAGLDYEEPNKELPKDDPSNPDTALENTPGGPESNPSDNDSNSTSDLEENPSVGLEPAENESACNSDGVPENSPAVCGTGNVPVLSTEDDLGDPSQLPSTTDGSSSESPKLALSESTENFGNAVPPSACKPSNELPTTGGSNNDPESTSTSTSVINHEIGTGIYVRNVRSKSAKVKGRKVSSHEKKSKPPKKRNRSQSIQLPVVNFPAADAAAAAKVDHHQRRSVPTPIPVGSKTQTHTQGFSKQEHSIPANEATMPNDNGGPLPFLSMREQTPEAKSVDSSCRERERREGIIHTSYPLLDVRYYQKELEKTKEQLISSQVVAVTKECEQDKKIARLEKEASKIEQLSKQLAAKEKECYKLRCQISDEIDRGRESDRKEKVVKWNLYDINLALEMCRSYTTSDEYFCKIFAKMHEKTKGLNIRPWSIH